MNYIYIYTDTMNYIYIHTGRPRNKAHIALLPRKEGLAQDFLTTFFIFTIFHELSDENVACSMFLDHPAHLVTFKQGFWYQQAFLG